ncbi:MAG: hypothetical protein ACYDCN_08300, partial [Bacteroidia bacterium]
EYIDCNIEYIDCYIEHIDCNIEGNLLQVKHYLSEFNRPPPLRNNEVKAITKMPVIYTLHQCYLALTIHTKN